MSRHSSKGARADGPVVIGRNTVRELLRHAPERFEEIVVSDRVRDSDFLNEIRKAGLKCRVAAPVELDSLSGGDAHQGVVARLKPREGGQSLGDLIDRLEATPRVLLLLLDNIQDPHNLGAILRAAECFGASGAIWSKNRGAPLTAAVTKVSMGATELVPIVLVANLADAVRKLKERSFWVVATAVGADARPLESFEFPERTALILGSEGEGIQPLLLKEADFTVHITMTGRLESLNVSQAAAVSMYQWARQKP